MRRHLLALFALFSGIAALQAPAHAAALDSTMFDARAFAQANDGSASEQCVHAAQKQQIKKRCPKHERALTPRGLRVALLPSVFVGCDRALE